MMHDDEQRKMLIEYMETYKSDMEFNYKFIYKGSLMIGFIMPRVENYNVTGSSDGRIHGEPIAVANLYFSFVIRYMLMMRDALGTPPEDFFNYFINRLFDIEYDLEGMNYPTDYARVKFVKD